MTVSIGVADRQDDEEIDQLFNRVDKALYAAKKEGRNRVRLYLVEKY
ncbi:Probable diguanylate cyclase YdaM [Raoultella terrigena]|uniref:diguanylate cyclase n=1 Tax=Raoultella terrigena TaxID=577 RepID=A0A3P8KY00_RAOTE|nr:Probable diguanylate cyclase YdaM [Raoultella terrigena]